MILLSFQKVKFAMQWPLPHLRRPCSQTQTLSLFHLHLKGVKTSSLMVSSSNPSFFAVVSALATFNAASNVASYASLRPERRCRHAPAQVKIYPSIKKYLTSYLLSSSSSKVSGASQRKVIPAARCNLSSEPCIPSLILTSWMKIFITRLKWKLPHEKRNFIP